jgi:hypothetical protein
MRAVHHRSTGAAWLALCAAITISSCGGNQAERRAEGVSSEAHTYSTSPGAAAEILSGMVAPIGFGADKSCGQDGGVLSICFTRSRSVVLDDLRMTRMIGESGARVEPKTVECSSTSGADKPRLRLVACSARATLGGDHLVLTARSLVIAQGAKESPTARSAPGVRSGAEIVVTDVGH